MFYERLGNGRSVLSFERTLNNTRDEYDSHLPNNTRVGWFKDGRPKKLSTPAERVFRKYESYSQSDLWNEVRPFTDLEAIEYESEFNDLIAAQENEGKEESESTTEGGKKVVISTRYERRPSLRNKAFKHHGVDCMVCGFNFYEVYGDWGKGFAEVHHIVPLSETNTSERKTDPQEDLAVVCANCHKMIHRKKGVTLTIEELRRKMRKA